MENDKNVQINWFPGHMAKTRKKLKEDLKLVDIAAEIIDARIPISSRNPEIDSILSNKPRLIVLNKADLADDVQTDKWQEYFKSIGLVSIKLDCTKGRAVTKLYDACKFILKEKIKRWSSKGILNKNIKVMVVGIPNVGKSTLINNLTKKRRAKTENKPGITRSNQWFTINNGFELLDTPGVLWPKFESQTVAQNLAFTGAVKDSVLDYEGLAFNLIKVMLRKYPENLVKRFDLKSFDSEDPNSIIEEVGKKRGMLKSGGSVDSEKVCRIIINEFKSGKFGKITLESVGDVIANR